MPTALITGGSRGIGLGIARSLAETGFDVAINGMREERSVQPILEELRETGAEVLYCRGDVSSGRDRDAMLEAVRARFGHLHVLVNNAGIAPPQRRDVLEATEESFERVMQVNLQGPFFLTQAAARWMIEQKERGEDAFFTIINVGSVSATFASVNRGEYCISKAGIGMATQLWATRLGEFGIPVYEIRPGIIATDMTAGVREKYDRLIEEGLMVQPRWGDPSDVGRVAAALADGRLAYSTGQIIMVDGGMSIPRL